MKPTLVFILILISNFMLCQKEFEDVNKMRVNFEKAYYSGVTSELELITQAKILEAVSSYNEDNTNLLFSLFVQSHIYTERMDFTQAFATTEKALKIAYAQNNYTVQSFLLLDYALNLKQLNQLKEANNVIDNLMAINDKIENEDEKILVKSLAKLYKTNLIFNEKDGSKTNMQKIKQMKWNAYQDFLSLSKSYPHKRFYEFTFLISNAFTSALMRDFNLADQLINRTDQLLKIQPNYRYNILNSRNKCMELTMKNDYKGFSNEINKTLLLAKKTNITEYNISFYEMLANNYNANNDLNSSTNVWGLYKLEADKLDENKNQSNDLNRYMKIRELYSPTGLLKPVNYWIMLSSFLFFVVGFLFCYFVVLPEIKLRRNRTHNNNQSKNYTNQEFYKKQNEAVPDKISDKKKYKERYKETVIYERKKQPTQEEKELTKPLTEAEITKNLLQLAKDNVLAFFIEFQKTYPKFAINIQSKFSELNNIDINYCALLILNFDVKTISKYTNTSLRSVESRRYRIRKKMGLLGNDDLNLALREFLE